MLKKFGSLFLIFEISLWVGILFSGIGIYPIEILFHENDWMLTAMNEHLIRSILGTVGTGITLFFLARRDAYRDKEVRLASIWKTVLLVFVAQQILALAFRYRFFIAGMTQNLASAFYWKNGTVAGEPPIWINHICMLALDLIFFIPAFLVGEYFGIKKCEKERAELLQNVPDLR